VLQAAESESLSNVTSLQTTVVVTVDAAGRAQAHPRRTAGALRSA
jgi:hypothetical protein